MFSVGHKMLFIHDFKSHSPGPKVRHLPNLFLAFSALVEVVYTEFKRNCEHAKAISSN